MKNEQSKRALWKTYGILMGIMLGGSAFVLAGQGIWSSIQSEKDRKLVVENENQPTQETQKNNESGQSARDLSTTYVEENDPDRFIKEHYLGLNRRDYERTWTDLSTDFKVIAGGYSAYTEWWDKVANIQLNSTRIVSQEANQVIIDANLQYEMKSGETVYDEKSRIYLEWNAKESHWDIINKVTP
jgi:hypothetical protein